MPATTTTAKAALLLLALLCAAFQWKSLRSYLSYQTYHQLADLVGDGRLEAEDAVWITDTLERPDAITGFLAPQLLRTTALLHLYHVDLIAAAKGQSALKASQDPDLAAARLKAVPPLKTALSRAPYDGDLWLRLALITRASGIVEDKSNHYLRRSHETAPHEGWVMQRRPPVTPPIKY